jgi:hypothetical protein
MMVGLVGSSAEAIPYRLVALGWLDEPPSKAQSCRPGVLARLEQKGGKAFRAVLASIGSARGFGSMLSYVIFVERRKLMGKSARSVYVVGTPYILV